MRHVYLIQIDGAQYFSCMCMCIECLLQVLKQKNAHVFFLWGWYYTFNLKNSNLEMFDLDLPPPPPGGCNIRRLSEHCSVCVSCVGLSTKQLGNRAALGQPPQLYSEHLRTVLGQNDSPENSFEAVALLVGFSSGSPLKLALSQLGNVHETIL